MTQRSFQASFNDDDDNHLWIIDDDDDEIETLNNSNFHLPKETSSPLQQILPTSSDIQLRKSPLKLVIKRLQPTNRSTKIKYQFQAIPPASLTT